MNEKMATSSFLTETITIIPVSQFLPLLEEIKSLILTKSGPSKDDTWFTLNGICNYHPDGPSKQTVYGWVSKRTIPFYKDGKNLRFLKSEIDEWLKRGKVKTSKDIENEVEQSIQLKRKNRKSLELIRDSLGHSSAKTTEHYLGAIDAEEIHKGGQI